MQTDSFMCLSPLAKPTFQQRHSINHCLCRNLIQSLRSLHCDWVYFCFLKSQEFHRWLPDPPSLGKGVGGLPTGKILLSSNRDSDWGAHHSQDTQGSQPLGILVRAENVQGTGSLVNWSEILVWLHGSPVDGEVQAHRTKARGGAWTKGQEWFWYKLWPFWDLRYQTMFLGFRGLYYQCLWFVIIYYATLSC